MLDAEKQRIADKYFKIVLRGFMDGELKWFPFNKLEALEDLKATQKRFKKGLWSHRKMRRQIRTRLKRLERWETNFPEHRTKKFYTMFTLRIRKFARNSFIFNNYKTIYFHVLFDATDPDRLSCKLLGLNHYSDSAQSANPEVFAHDLTGSYEVIATITDDLFPELVTLLCLTNGNLVQELNLLPKPTFTCEYQND